MLAEKSFMDGSPWGFWARILYSAECAEFGTHSIWLAVRAAKLAAGGLTVVRYLVGWMQGFGLGCADVSVINGAVVAGLKRRKELLMRRILSRQHRIFSGEKNERK
jgi:hypothetical protein